MIWLPVPFLAGDVVEAAYRRTVAALRTGGWLIAETIPPAVWPQQQAIAEWRAE